MALILTQTDTAASKSWSTQCSSAADGDAATLLSNDALDGGTAGSTPVTIDALKTAAFNGVYFTSGAVGVTSWPGGSGNEITFRLNISAAAADTNIVKVSACRMNSSGVSQGTYGVWTGTTSLGTTGVKTFTLTTTAQSAAATDWVLFVVEHSNTSHANNTYDVTPDQDIDTAIVVPVIHAGAAALTASGTLTSSATNLQQAAGAMSATGTVDAAGSFAHTAAAAMAGAGTITAVATNEKAAVASLLGFATLSVSTDTTGAVAMSASASLVHVARSFYLNSASPGGQNYYVEADLTGSTLAPHHAGLILRGDADSGYLGYYDADLSRYVIAKAVAGVVTVLASATEAYSDGRLRFRADDNVLTLYKDGVQKVQTTDSTYSNPLKGGVYSAKMQGTYGAGEFISLDNFTIYNLPSDALAALSASATLSATVTLTQAASSTLAATATLAASGTTGILHQAQAPLAATTNLTAISSLLVVGATTLPATATLGATTAVTRNGASALNGAATFNASGAYIHQAIAAYNAQAALIAPASLSILAAASYSATATLAASATIQGIQLGNAALAATATLAASADITRAGAAAFASTATLAGTAVETYAASSNLPATVTFDATIRAVRAAATLQQATGTLSASATMDNAAASAQAAQATIAATPHLNWVASASVISNATLAAQEADLITWDTFTEAAQTDLANHTGDLGHTWGASVGNLALKIDTAGKVRLDL